MERLGNPRYGAQGGDTGSVVSPLVGRLAPDRVIGVHLNGGLAFPGAEPGDLDNLSDSDQAKLASALDHLLANVSIYWFTNTSATAANLYYESGA